MQEGCLNEQMTGVKKFGETAFGLSFPISANGADVAECPEGRSSIIRDGTYMWTMVQLQKAAGAD
jgi:hypothetical protein